MKHQIFVATLVAISSASVFANEEKFYFGAEVGSMSIDNRTQEIANEAVALVGGSATVTQTVRKGAGRIFAGVSVNENVDIELGYIQSQDFNTTIGGRATGNVNYSAVGKVDVSGFDYSVLLRPSKASGFNGVFFRLGQHDYETNATFSMTVGGSSVTIPTQKTSGKGAMFGVGFDWDIEKNLGVRFAVTQLNKISGISSADATFISVGVKSKF